MRKTLYILLGLVVFAGAAGLLGYRFLAAKDTQEAPFAYIQRDNVREAAFEARQKIRQEIQEKRRQREKERVGSAEPSPAPPSKQPREWRPNPGDASDTKGKNDAFLDNLAEESPETYQRGAWDIFNVALDIMNVVVGVFGIGMTLFGLRMQRRAMMSMTMNNRGMSMRQDQ